MLFRNMRKTITIKSTMSCVSDRVKADYIKLQMHEEFMGNGIYGERYYAPPTITLQADLKPTPKQYGYAARGWWLGSFCFYNRKRYIINDVICAPRNGTDYPVTITAIPYEQ